MSYLNFIIFFGSYAIIRFLAPPIIHFHLGLYGIYFVEAAFCLLAITYYIKRFKLNLKLGKKFLKSLVLSLALGLITYQTAYRSHMVIPFDLSDSTTILLLTLLGPILEEFLFRFSLLWPLEDILPRKVTILLSALFFSFCHLIVLNKVPSAMHSFIYFQGIYTFFLAIWWGKSYLKDLNILRPIALHITFNTGFFAGSFLL